MPLEFLKETMIGLGRTVLYKIFEFDTWLWDDECLMCNVIFRPTLGYMGCFGVGSSCFLKLHAFTILEYIIAK